MQLPNAPWLTRPDMLALLVAFQAGGQSLRVVGGAVRDALLGRAVHDIDCATPALPDAVMALLQAAHIKAIPTGIAHGTITAVVDGTPFQITTLRHDTACDGRHAQVAFGTSWQEDAARRDFTMNALYCDVDGTVYDYFGGVADAKSGSVRFIGDAQQRIREDGLRILRFFRFYASHGSGAPDAAALQACTAKRDMLAGLSGERIQHEMLRLLATATPLPALQAMQDCGLLELVCRAADVPADALQRLASDDALLRLALILRHGNASPAPLVERWKLSGADAARLHALCMTETLGIPADTYQLLRELRLYGRELRHDLLLRDAAEQALDPADWLTECAHIAIPQFPVTGQDLLKAGLAQGQALGETLRKLEEDWEAERYQPDKATLLARI